MCPFAMGSDDTYMGVRRIDPANPSGEDIPERQSREIRKTGVNGSTP